MHSNCNHKKWPDSRFLGATEGYCNRPQNPEIDLFMMLAIVSKSIEHGRQQTGLDALAGQNKFRFWAQVNYYLLLLITTDA